MVSVVRVVQDVFLFIFWLVWDIRAGVVGGARHLKIIDEECLEWVRSSLCGMFWIGCFFSN